MWSDGCQGWNCPFSPLPRLCGTTPPPLLWEETPLQVLLPNMIALLETTVTMALLVVAIFHQEILRWLLQLLHRKVETPTSAEQAMTPADETPETPVSSAKRLVPSPELSPVSPPYEGPPDLTISSSSGASMDGSTQETSLEDYGYGAPMQRDEPSLPEAPVVERPRMQRRTSIDNVSMRMRQKLVHQHSSSLRNSSQQSTSSSSTMLRASSRSSVDQPRIASSQSSVQRMSRRSSLSASQYYQQEKEKHSKPRASRRMSMTQMQDMRTLERLRSG